MKWLICLTIFSATSLFSATVSWTFAADPNDLWANGVNWGGTANVAGTFNNSESVYLKNDS